MHLVKLVMPEEIASQVSAILSFLCKMNSYANFLNILVALWISQTLLLPVVSD